MTTIMIGKGREKPIIQQHPWIFSGAIARVEGDPAPGDIVTVVSSNGKFLARGYWNPKSQIQVRILTWRDEPIDDAWWRMMLNRAIQARATLYPATEHPIACRLINAENDYLPGLIVDRYGDYLVLQALTLGIDQRKELIVQLLSELLPLKGIYERSDVDVRGKEGLKFATGVLWGAEPPVDLEIWEDLRLLIDVRDGHKTGFYLDQAANRRLLFDLINNVYSTQASCRVLNLFSYTGGFSLQALRHGNTEVISVDSSQEVLSLAERNLALNPRFDRSKAKFVQADVFDYLREQNTAQFDIVVLDPPKFAQNQQQIEKAARGYKDINLNAIKLIKPGGYLMTFSCSGAISPDLFQKIVFGALADTRRQAQILKHLGASEDHPIALTFPEGEYLKGLLLRVY